VRSIEIPPDVSDLIAALVTAARLVRSVYSRLLPLRLLRDCRKDTVIASCNAGKEHDAVIGAGIGRYDTRVRHNTMSGQICCRVFARVSEHNSLTGRATWLVVLPANLPFGQVGRVVCVARSNASAIEWPREPR
jgi:hypothetical protein